MEYPIEIRSKKAFIAWVRKQNKAQEERQFFIRAFPGETTLYLHTAERFEMLYGPFIPFPLPGNAKEAACFWERFDESGMTSCFVYEDGINTIWCKATYAVWNALPQLHIFMDLTEFREVSHEDFDRIVGDQRILDEMFEECWHMGISVRNADQLRTPDGELLLEKRKAEQKKAMMKPTRKGKAKKRAGTEKRRTKKKR